MNRTHPPTYPRPNPEDGIDILDVMARLVGAACMILGALLLVAIW